MVRASSQAYEGEFALKGGGILMVLATILPAIAFGYSFYEDSYTFEKFMGAPAMPISYGLATLGFAFFAGGVATAATSRN